jgi:acyl phosphate:glycerol-3-phosphate acyltransferase
LTLPLFFRIFSLIQLVFWAFADCSMPHIILAAALGYLLGSLPTAYLLVRWKSREDIRQAGSKNVGALNSYLVTHSRTVGLAVLILDLLKGIAAVLAAEFVFAGGAKESAVAGLAAVAGHNFPVCFKGGRGLATAAGVLLLLVWPTVPLWISFWAVGFWWTRNINVGNAIATVLTLALALIMPAWMLQRIVPEGFTSEGVRVFVSAMMLLILIKHMEPVRAFLQERRRETHQQAGSVETEKERS